MKEELVQSLIGTRREDDWWDFKEFHYEDKGSMFHDIICLANNRANRDSYLIFGVRDKTFEITGIENDSNRRNQQNIVDFMRTQNFAGQVRPRVEVQTVLIDGHEIDVCRAYNKLVSDYPEYDIDVKLCAYTASSMQEAKPVVDQYQRWVCEIWIENTV